MSGEHDELSMEPEDEIRLGYHFWTIIRDSGYPPEYQRLVTRAVSEEFLADVTATARATVEDAEAYLGLPRASRPCPCKDCTAARERGELP